MFVIHNIDNVVIGDEGREGTLELLPNSADSMRRVAEVIAVREKADIVNWNW